MIKNMLLGQYLPGNSVLHKLDPRVKIIYSFVLIIAVFCANNYAVLIGLGIFIIFIAAISKISLKLYFKSLKPVFFIIAFTSIVNLFYGKGEIVFEWLFIKITQAAINNSLLIFIRLFNLMFISAILTFTTSITNLTDALERIMKPLYIFKINVSFIAMMITIAIRFIPTLIDETDRIMNAQKSRGVSFNSGGLIKRIKCFIPVLVPLFISAFYKAYDISVAMECRCYIGGKNRTKMNELKFCKLDLFAMLSIILVAVGVVVCNVILPGTMR